MKQILLSAIFIMLSSCAIRATETKTITVPIQDKPVTITVKGTATCHDYFLFYKVSEQLDVQSTGRFQVVSQDAYNQGTNIAYGQVLCCCETYSGQCCAWVNFCGSFIPGCFCR